MGLRTARADSITTNRSGDYGSYRARVQAAPKGHAMDYVHCYFVIRKELREVQVVIGLGQS